MLGLACAHLHLANATQTLVGVHEVKCVRELDADIAGQQTRSVEPTVQPRLDCGSCVRRLWSANSCLAIPMLRHSGLPVAVASGVDRELALVMKHVVGKLKHMLCNERCPL